MRAQTPTDACHSPIDRSNAGFTILELSAAVFVMTVALLGVAQLCRFAVDRMRTLEEQTIAIQAMQNEIETLRAMPFTALTDGTRPFLSTYPGLDRLGPLVETRTVITPHAAAPTRLKEVTVAIVWRTEHARRTERSVTTLISEKTQ